MLLILRLNCFIVTPLPTLLCHDHVKIDSSVDIGADLSPIFGTVQAGSWPDPLPTKDVFFLIVVCVVRKRIKIKKARFAGIALFPDFYLGAGCLPPVPIGQDTIALWRREGE